MQTPAVCCPTICGMGTVLRCCIAADVWGHFLCVVADDSNSLLPHPPLQASCLRDSPETTTFLGTSPPVRSGASNPLIHDVKWGACPDFQLIDLPCGMSSWRNIHTHSSNSPDGPWAVQHSASPSPTVL